MASLKNSEELGSLLIELPHQMYFLIFFSINKNNKKRASTNK